MSRKRLLIGLTTVWLLALAACTSGGTPEPVPSTATAGSTAAGSTTSSTTTTATTPAAPENAALNRCDDLGLLPCIRQVAQFSLPIAGTSISLTYSSDRAPGRKVDPSPSAASVGLAGWSLSVLDSYDPATKTLITGTGLRRQVTGKTVNGGTEVADVTGRQVDVFDSQGRQTAALDAGTGASMLTFGWDAHGLQTVSDTAGLALTVTRAADGTPTGLQVPNGAATSIGTIVGHLVAVAYPDGTRCQLKVNDQGLLTEAADAAGVGTEFDYDSSGRLVNKTDSTGARTTYGRETSGGNLTITTTLPGGGRAVDVTAINSHSTTWTHTDASGVSRSVTANAAQRAIGLPGGRSVTVTLAPDPRFGMDAPVAASVVDGVSRAIGETTGTTKKVTVDGNTWTYGYDSTSRTSTTTDPAGVTRSAIFDTHGRVITEQNNGLGTTYTYDTSGRIVSVTLGTGADARDWKYAYDRRGPVTVTDPAGGVQVRTSSATGGITSVVGPGNSGLNLHRDAAGRVNGFSAPGGSPFDLTLRADGQVAAVNSPGGQGGPQFTGYDYDASGRVVKVVTADKTLTAARDDGGKLTTFDAGNGVNVAAYDNDGRLTGWTNPGVTVTQGYTGAAVTKESLSGIVTGAVSRTVDAAGRTSAESVSTTSFAPDSVPYNYDAAGRLTKAGDLAITRDRKTGRTTNQTLGTLTTTWTVNQFGETTAEKVTGAGGSTVADITYQRDKLGRVTGMSTTAGGQTSKGAYRYDAAGRLSSETTDSATTSYLHDAAGNLTSVTAPSGAVTTFTYDARDALLSRGDTKYTYDGAGRLASATSAAGVTTYTYDATGALLSVKQPGKPEITYTVDGFGRRVATSVGGKLSSGVLYRDATRPAAELDASGNVTKRYVYSGFSPLPAYLTEGTTDYLEVPDIAGGPGLVVNASTGQIADRVSRTAFGTVTTETVPGFQAIGFGGGIIDPATSLVRFGARDLDTSTGRWTAPDPLGIAGGSANLYEYVGSDPVNRSDVAGTSCDYLSIGVTYGGGIGPAYGGGSIGLATAGGQIGTYSTFGTGVGFGAGGGIGIQCMDKDDHSSPGLDDFSGMGRNAEGSLGPVTAGGDTGYNSRGDPSSHGWHAGLGPNSGVGGDVTQSITSILCLFHCPPPPICVNGVCDPNPTPPSQPSDPCAGYPCADPPHRGGGPFGKGARSTGDPHLRTQDSTYYDMQGAGEFTAVATDTGDLTVQVRQQPLTGSTNVAITTAAALSVNGDRLMITQSGAVLQVQSASGTIPGAGTFSLPHGAKVLRDEDSVVITMADGSLVGVSTNPKGLNVNTDLADARKGQVHGLLGPFTGNSPGSVQGKDGATYSVEQLKDYDTLYGKYAQSWRIAQADSLFTYDAGKTTATYTDRTFPARTQPAIADAARAAAEKICRQLGLPDEALPGCIEDVALTGDAGFASTMARDSGTVPASAAGPSSVSGAITPGKTVTGTIAAGASQTFPFTVTAGTVAYFSAAKTCAVNGLRWNVEAADGSALVGSSAICQDIGRVQFTRAGGYHLKIYADSGGAGSFTATWTQSRPDGVKAIIAGQQITASIDKPGAQDIYMMAVTSGTVAYFSATPGCKQADPDHTVRWAVQDADGTGYTGSSNVCDDIGRVQFKSSGAYRLVVYSDTGGTANYSITWTASRPDVTKALIAGQQVTSAIDRPGSQDLYSLAVTAGTVAYFSAHAGCTPGDDHHQIRWAVQDFDGTGYTGSSNVCDDLGRVQFKTTGTYRIAVYSESGGTGAYGLAWTASRPDLVRPLTVGGIVSGTIDLPGAQDRWTFAVTTPSSITLTAHQGCTDTKIRWQVFGPDGVSVSGDPDICTDLGKVSLTTAGTYTVVISDTDAATGAYSFSSAQ